MKSQKTFWTFEFAATEYNPLEVCPAAFKLVQDVGIPKYVGLGLTSAYPITLWNPEKTIAINQYRSQTQSIYFWLIVPASLGNLVKLQ